jgi:hypothetical protein
VENKFLISIKGDAARRNIAIQELSQMIEQSLAKHKVAKQVQMKRMKVDKKTQDFGATLVVVLGTPAALALAKGIHDFISKYGDSVVISTPKGIVKATGGATKNIDVAKTVEALEGKTVKALEGE